MTSFAQPEYPQAVVAEVDGALDNLDTDELAAFIYTTAPNPGRSLEVLGLFFPHLHLEVEGER